MLPADWDGQPLVIGTAVIVDGATASQLTDVLILMRESWHRNGRDLPESLEAAAAAFHLADDRWSSEARAKFRNRNSGTPDVGEALILCEMTTADVAARLGISCRAVTKRAHTLGGRKIGHRYLFDGVIVETAAQRREETCNGSC